MTWAWLALTVIAVGSWWLAPGHSAVSDHASVPIAAVALILGLIKSRLIIRYFMEVRTAPGWLKLATDAWLGTLFVAVFAIYLI